MTTDKSLLTNEQVAELIGITPSQVLKLRRLPPLVAVAPRDRPSLSAK